MEPTRRQPASNGVIDQPWVHLSYLRAIKLHLVGLLKGFIPSLRPANSDRGRASGCGQDRSAGPVRFCHHLRDGGDGADSARLRCIAETHVKLLFMSAGLSHTGPSASEGVYRVVGFLDSCAYRYG